MGKVLVGVLGTVIIGILVIFLLVHFGLLSWGPGNGKGDGNIDSEAKSEAVVDESSVINDETKEITINIVITQDQYSIDEQVVTLTQIREKLTDESAMINVVLEDNYASAKAWDEIKTSLAEWGITPIEQ